MCELSPYVSPRGECLECTVEDSDGALFKTYFDDNKKVYYSNVNACAQFKVCYENSTPLYCIWLHIVLGVSSRRSLLDMVCVTIT